MLRWIILRAALFFTTLLFAGPAQTEPYTPAKFLKINSAAIFSRLKKPMQAAGVLYPPKAVRLAVFKAERKAELWLPGSHGVWHYVKDYNFTAMSGKQGPKIYYGDLQIPEGVYGIDAMWLSRDYHLALHVDYPNAFDKAMLQLEGRDPGYVSTGINVHGGAVSYGCVVIGNRNIEEVFLLASAAGKENTQVFIFPHDTDRSAPKFRECPDCPVWYGELTRQFISSLKDFRR